MLPLPRFALHAPKTVDEVVALLRDLGPDTTVVAGGTDLFPNMKHGLLAPRNLVSLADVPALRGVWLEGEALRVGAMTNLETVAAHEVVRTRAAALAEAALSVGGPHHRRMGTLGGNLCLDTRCRYYNQTHFWREALGYCLKKDGSKCHVVEGGRNCVAAASNDTAAALLVLDATIELVGAGGARTVPIRDFYTADGIANTTRAPGEIVVAVRVPVREGRASVYEKLRRRASIDFPMISLGARIDVAEGRVVALDVAVSALAARPRTLRGAQAFAEGKAPADVPRGAIADAAFKECAPLPNIEGDPVWRKKMVRVLVGRALGRLGLGGA